MKKMQNSPTRLVSPRKWAAATVAGLAVASPAIPTALLPQAVLASEVGEAGESGEAGVTRREGPSDLLTQLGYFEGAYRIIAQLYRSGARDLAREHLELSHHAYYEDIAPELKAYDAPGFESLDQAFKNAVIEDAPVDAVDRALAAVLDGLDAAARAAGATPRQRLMSIHDLMTLAAAEYEGGVEDGHVELDMEYRDSWGFFETARQRAMAMAASEDAALAKAGQDVLQQMQGLEAFYPGLTAETVAGDTSQLNAAAGWIEIIALRQK